MKSKVWLCRAEAEKKVVAEDANQARIQFITYLFNDPGKINTDVVYLADVEVLDKKGGN